MKTEFISAKDITEELCLAYRKYLLKEFNGEIPGNYFEKFKKVMKAATKARYFQENPSDGLVAKTKPNRKVKDILESEEYLQLLKAPFLKDQVKRAFIFCLYSGLRWCDVKPLIWENVKDTYFEVFQKKTGHAIIGYDEGQPIIHGKAPTFSGSYLVHAFSRLHYQ